MYNVYELRERILLALQERGQTSSVEVKDGAVIVYLDGRVYIARETDEGELRLQLRRDR